MRSRNEETGPAREAFSNEALAAEGLPAHREVRLDPISPRYAIRATLIQGIGWAGAAVLSLLAIAQGIPLAGAATWILLALGLVASSLAWVEARQRAFALRERDVIYERGVLVRTRVIVSRARSCACAGAYSRSASSSFAPIAFSTSAFASRSTCALWGSPESR